jgi:hypothetical protein
VVALGRGPIQRLSHSGDEREGGFWVVSIFSASRAEAEILLRVADEVWPKAAAEIKDNITREV